MQTWEDGGQESGLHESKISEGGFFGLAMFLKCHSPPGVKTTIILISGNDIYYHACLSLCHVSSEI